MKYKGLVDPKNKPFGNLLPFEVQVIIMFWTQCFMTNDRRKKMNAELTRLPRCLGTDIPKFVVFSFPSGYKSFSSAMENKPYPHFYGCPHCFRRNTQQVSVSMFINFPSVLFHAYQVWPIFWSYLGRRIQRYSSLNYRYTARDQIRGLRIIWSFC